MIIKDNPRFTLRTWEPDDAPSLTKQINNKKIWDNCRDGLPYPYTIDDACFYIKSVSEDNYSSQFCICIDGNAVGNIGFVRNTDIYRYSAEVGYWIGEEFWNCGIGTDALKIATDYYFGNSDVIRLHASVFIDNKASARVLEKVGFTLKCTLNNAAFKNGRFTDVLCYELIKPGF